VSEEKEWKAGEGAESKKGGREGGAHLLVEWFVAPVARRYDQCCCSHLRETQARREGVVW